MSIRLNGGILEIDLSTYGIDVASSAFTIGMWVKKIGNFTNYDPPLSFGVNYNSRGNSIELQTASVINSGTDSHLSLGLNGDGVFTATNLFSSGTWYYVAYTRSAGSTSFNGCVYFGNLGNLAQVSTGNLHSSSGTYRYLRLGDLKQTGLVTPFNGEIAHIRVWKSELNTTQLSAESSSATPVITTNLVYGCQLSNTTTKTDLSGNSIAWVSSGTVANGASEPIVATPSITTINGSSANIILSPTSTNISILGISLTGTTVNITQDTQTVTQTITASSDTSITFNFTGANFKYGSATLNIVLNGVTTSKSITISPADSRSWVNIVTPNSTANNRITATQDITAGDQLEVVAVNGGAISDVNINSDGTFDAPAAVTSFTCRAWSAADSTWGSVGTQLMVAAAIRRRIIIIG